jgi:hypothetical protein
VVTVTLAMGHCNTTVQVTTTATVTLAMGYCNTTVQVTVHCNHSDYCNGLLQHYSAGNNSGYSDTCNGLL